MYFDVFVGRKVISTSYLSAILKVLLPESTRNLLGDWPILEPRTNLLVALESNCGSSDLAG